MYENGMKLDTWSTILLLFMSLVTFGYKSVDKRLNFR